jgi:predicted permease
MKRPGLRRWLTLPLSRAAIREREVDAEIALHLALRAEQLEAEGYSADAARAAAWQRFSARADVRRALQVDAQHREVRMGIKESIGAFLADASFAARQLRRSPVFTVIGITAIALGVGVNATMFGIIDRLLLRPPAHVTSPERVATASVTFTSRKHTFTQTVLSYPIFHDLAPLPQFQSVAAFSNAQLTLGHGASTREIRGIRATPEYFSALGVAPKAGRFFDPTADPDLPAGPDAVVTERYAATTFGSASGAVGQSIELGGAPFTVIGVAPDGFTGIEPSRVEVWIPFTAGLSAADIAHMKEGRQDYSLGIVARVQPKLSLIEAAGKASEAIRAGELRDGYALDRVRRQNPIVALTSVLPREARGDTPETRVAILLSLMSLFVLLLACANVINLQFSRAAMRQREIAIRLALGVSRGRLVRLLLTESLIVTLLGGVAAVALAQWGGAIMRATLLRDLDWPDVPMDATVIAYAVAAAIVTGFVTGLLPALRFSRHGLGSDLRNRQGGASARAGIRFWLLVTQSALALVLLIGTGLFGTSLRRIDAVPLGLAPEQLVVVTLNTAGRQYDSVALATLYRRVAGEVRSAPGVEHSAVSMTVPFGSSWAIDMFVPGRDSLPVTADGGPYVNAVGTDFFATVGTQIRAGRGFTLEDGAGAPPVVVISQTTAKLWWPFENAIGKCIKLDTRDSPCATIVGIAENSHRQSIIEDAVVQVFVPAEQATTWASPRVVLAKLDGDAAKGAAALQRRLQSSDPTLPYVSVQRFMNRIESRTQSWRLGATMFGVFGTLALILAAVGVYGVLAYDVSHRRQEIGVRIALGGTPSQIAMMIVNQGLIVAAVGACAGVCIAIAAHGKIEPLLFQTSALEPAIYLAALLLIGIVAAIAAWIPARRAAAVDPIVTLKSD